MTGNTVTAFSGTGLKGSIDSGSGAARWQYLDLCRVLAIFGVVMIHIVPMWLYPVDSFDWNALSFYNSLSRVCVPLFVMISGALLLAPGREVPLKTLYGKYLLRFVTCLLFWSAMYYLFIVYARDPSFHWRDFEPRRFIASVLGGHPYHHWFLFMIITLYIISPLLRHIAGSRRLTLYYLALWGVFEIGVYSLQLVGTAFPDLGATGLFWLGQADAFANKVTPTMVMGMSGYMVLGYYLHANPPRGAALRLLQVLGLAGLAVTLLGTYAISLRAGQLAEAFYSARSLAVLAMSVAVFVSARAMWPAATRKENRLLKTVAECSFGVYLIHDFFLVFLGGRGFTPALFSRAVSPLLVNLAYFCLCLGAVYLIRKIPLARKYIT